MILLKQFQEGRARAVRELMIMLIVNTTPLLVNYARKLMRKVLMLTGLGKCLLLLEKKANELESKDDSEKLEEQPAEE
jgi:hypothetical protein